MNEGYLPLYRKYRPQKLEDVVGQEHIKTALTNAIKLNKIAHAYLFTGPRGTGKTSTARILAKSLNCVNGPTIEPCGKCESCKAITDTIPIDVIEIDAASNRSVEDAHNILEKVQYAPVSGKYKIYIIDEVHMLTPQAFNALLKTLEEPPKNVVFILATTEAHKVLDTIKSRCQRFDFKRITTNDIIEHLKKISKKESINITESALSVIAKSSSGGMRDSLALLDQASIIGTSKEITEGDINNLLGRLSFEVLYELADCIVNSNPASAVNVLEKIYNNGSEPLQILTNLMIFFKNLLIAKTCDLKISEELTALADIQLKSLEKFKNSLETHQILFLINKTAEYIKEIKETTNQQMWLEVALIDLSNLSVNTKLMDLQSRLSNLEAGSGVSIKKPIIVSVKNDPPTFTNTDKSVSQTPATEEKSTQDIPVNSSREDSEEKPEPQAVSASPTGTEIRALWAQILHNIASQPEQALFSLANPAEISENRIVLTIKNESFLEKANSPERKKYIIEAAETVLGKSDIPVLIRKPMSSDIKTEKVKISPPKRTVTVPPKDLVQQDLSVSDTELETVHGMKEEKQEPVQNHDDITHSDQGSMVKELFDGKYIE